MREIRRTKTPNGRSASCRSDSTHPSLRLWCWWPPPRRQYSGVDVVDDNDDEDEEKKADEDAAPLASEPSPPFDPS